MNDEIFMDAMANIAEEVGYETAFYALCDAIVDNLDQRYLGVVASDVVKAIYK